MAPAGGRQRRRGWDAVLDQGYECLLARPGLYHLPQCRLVAQHQCPQASAQGGFDGGAVHGRDGDQAGQPADEGCPRPGWHLFVAHLVQQVAAGFQRGDLFVHLV